MGFPRQEYWSGLPFPSPGDLPDAGIEPKSPASPALTGRFFTAELPGNPLELLPRSSSDAFCLTVWCDHDENACLLFCLLNHLLYSFFILCILFIYLFLFILFILLFFP